MPVDPDLFRAAVGSFPTGVAIVTCVDETGAPRGLTTNAFTSVSLDPPLVLVCIDRTSQTLPALVAARAFCINFLAAERAPLAKQFATKSTEKFAGVRWEPSDAASGAPMLIDDSIAVVACTIIHHLDAGDHVLVLGNVEDARAHPGAPLMFFRRTYGTWEHPSAPVLDMESDAIEDAR